MSNQIERSIEHATERVAKYGYLNPQDVTDRDITMAGFGHLASRMDKRFNELNSRTLTFRLDGKGILSASLALGGLLGAILQRMVGI